LKNKKNKSMVMKKPQKISSAKKVKRPVRHTHSRVKPELKLNVASSKKTAASKKDSVPMAPIRPIIGEAFIDNEVENNDVVVEPTVNESALSISTTPVPPTSEIIPNQPEDSIDSRQQFFQMMSEKIKADEPIKDGEEFNNDLLKNKSVSLYRKIAIRFAIFAGLIALIVAYFCFTKLTIFVDLNKETSNDNLIFDIYGGDKPAEAVRGVKGAISRFESEESGIYQSTGEVVSNAQFNGRVTIFNNNQKDQTLVATTRLLSPDGKLFRIKNFVNVKAGESVEVDVYPDTIESNVAINPTKFTIPGLRPDLQDKIYAESKTAFSFAGASKKIIQQSDVDNAAAELNNKLLEKVRQSIGSGNNQYDSVLYSVDPSALTVELIDAKVGDTKDEFTVKIKNVVNIVSFATTDVIKLAIEQKAAANNKDKSVFEINKDSLKFGINNYDVASNVANVSVDFVLGAAANNVDFIDKTKLVNLNKAQLESYFSVIKDVNSFEFKFFPSFIKRAPGLVDRINIVSR